MENAGRGAADLAQLAGDDDPRAAIRQSLAEIHCQWEFTLEE